MSQIDPTDVIRQHRDKIAARALSGSVSAEIVAALDDLLADLAKSEETSRLRTVTVTLEQFVFGRRATDTANLARLRDAATAGGITFTVTPSNERLTTIVFSLTSETSSEADARIESLLDGVSLFEESASSTFRDLTTDIVAAD